MILPISIALNICLISFIGLLFQRLFEMNADCLKIIEFNEELLEKQHLLLDRSIIYSNILLLIYDRGSKRK